MPTPAPPERAPPERIGPYELLFELAAGGMATVWVARKPGDAGFERIVAVKRVHAHLAREPETFDRLCDEARLAALVRHPNVVPVIDVVERAGELSLAMEYVEAAPLSALLRGPDGATLSLPPAIAARVMGDALRGLHAAHEARDLEGTHLGIVHRDFTPQNLLVGRDGTTRVIDFGVARAELRLVETSDGARRGKVLYMAPEQLRGELVDRRADVFAAAAVWLEAVTGERVRRGASEEEALVAALLEADAPRLPALEPVLGERAGPALALARRALSSDANARPSTALELAEAIEELCPPARERDVAALVEARQGARLERTRARIREALRAASELDLAEPTPRASSAEPTAQGLAPSDEVATNAAAPRGRSGRWVVAGLLLLGLGAALGIRSLLRVPARAASAPSSRAPLAAATSSPPSPSAGALDAAPPSPTRPMADGSARAPATSERAGAPPRPASRPTSSASAGAPSELQPSPYGAP
jgi:serine/threonine protein kinase